MLPNKAATMLLTHPEEVWRDSSRQTDVDELFFSQKLADPTRQPRVHEVVSTQVP